VEPVYPLDVEPLSERQHAQAWQRVRGQVLRASPSRAAGIGVAAARPGCDTPVVRAWRLRAATLPSLTEEWT
jgi:hypothetical protein